MKTFHIKSTKENTYCIVARDSLTDKFEMVAEDLTRRAAVELFRDVQKRYRKSKLYTEDV